MGIKRPKELGRSRGGFTTKLHGRCDGHGRPLGFVLAQGQAHDVQGFGSLLRMLGDRIEALLVDKSYNTAAIRGEIAAADVVVWGLYADPNTKLKAKIAGFYSCLSAEVIAGLSIGANALVGTQQEIALLPLKLDGQTGLNLAVGIASVTLAIAK